MMLANKKILLIVVILALVIGGAFYFLKKDSGIQLELMEKEKATTFGENIYEMVQNPAEKIPQTNPFKAKINPFEGLKINPFE
ncbi:hypothetical protein KAU40_02605 [Candidatus Parcubacteria bacterium]|nr:hypothetical protein [Candidatus Parcubacteria bacterium]